MANFMKGGIVISDLAKIAAKDFLKFVNKTGSPYHSVECLLEILKNKNFEKLNENESWNLNPGGKYYVKRNHSCIMAFTVGENFSSDHSGICIIAAHSDSPCLRLKPNSNCINEGYLQLGVECYGGGLWHTWFDRGLGCAGKVVIKNNINNKSLLEERLIRIENPIAILPNLAIHLLTSDERAAFKINNEKNLQPIICSKIKENLIGDYSDKTSDDGCQISPPLVKIIAKELKVKEEDIVDADICLMDATPSRLCGLHSEFIESPRLDNLISTFAAFDTLSKLSEDKNKKEGNEEANMDICVAIAFDHEEIGSTSWVGANSNILKDWLFRILKSLSCDSKFHEIISRSFLISADMAHALHPNYPEKHQKEHKVLIHQGVVLKENVNQRYTSHCTTMAICRFIANQANVKMQNFVVRNDSPCGSTVGPMLSSILGMRAVDVGICQWAMHSCRETCGVDDLLHLINFFKAFYKLFRNIDAKMSIL